MDIPPGDKIQLAKTLFCFENPPGTKYVSGSQDSLGIVLPGLNRLYYNGSYWPDEIEQIPDDYELFDWLEKHLWLLPLYPRFQDYDVLSDTCITPENAEGLSVASGNCWEAILEKNPVNFGKAVRESFEAQVKIFPHMVTEDIWQVIDKHKHQTLGWKLSGAGGGGYLIFVSEHPVENAIQVRIRRGEK